MKSNRLALSIAIGFLLLGSVCISLRVAFQEKRLLEVETIGWHLTYQVTIRPFKSSNKVYIRIPDDTEYYRINKESFDYNNLAVAHEKLENDGGRRLIGVSLLKSNQSGFTGEVEIRRRNATLKTAKLNSDERQFYLKAEPRIQVNSPEFQKIGEQLTASKIKTSRLIEAVFAYTRDEIERSSELNATDALSAVLYEQADTLGKARAMIAICRSLQIPSRLVTGFILQPGSDLHPHNWVEVYYKDLWHSFDPMFGYEWTVPVDYYPVARNAASLVTSSGALVTNALFSLSSISESQVTVHTGEGIGALVNLERLPISMRKVVSIVLLIPFGVLVTAIFRNLVGLSTFGTFAPSLLALSFVMSDWRTGLIILISVLSVGIAARAMLDRLKLLMVPRIGLILTLVIILMTMAISVFDYLGLTPSANAVLLPTVIIAMLIERVYIAEVEDGLRNVLIMMIGTILVAFSCFLVLNSEALRNLVISFPESEFILVAGLIIIGRYSGYRLTELVRFKDMIQNHHQDQK